MNGKTNDSDQSAATAVIKTSNVAEHDTIEQESATNMDCHQRSNAGSDVGSDTAKASGLCKIFCSAIGHAFLLTELAGVVENGHSLSPYSDINSLTTRPLMVEYQPPK